MVHAIVLITADPSAVANLAPTLADLEGVREVYSVAGDEDVVAIVRVPTHEELADVVTTRVAKQPGVVRTRTLIAFRSWSETDLSSEWGVSVE